MKLLRSLALSGKLIDMPCYHPRKMFDTGMLTDSGKKELVMAEGFDSRLNVYLAERKIKKKIPFNPEYMSANNGYVYLTKSIDVPCGQCIGCRLEYARQWAIRCVLESKCYPPDSCWFITLTYDEAHCPEHLVKKDFQDFMKRFRAGIERCCPYLTKEQIESRRIRFFACGEYGETTHRCHFHSIIFNWKPDDLKFWSQRNGQTYYRSKELEHYWRHGMCIVGECSFESCSYVARYVTKKRKGKDTSDEFLLMSRRPGIGRPYLDKLGLAAYETDKIYENVGFSHEFTPPKYYDRIMEKIDPNKVDSVKAARLIAATTNLCTQRVLHGFDSVEDLQWLQEDQTKNKIERLKRSKV